ncbi:lytic transglycosylase domain-containing protein [Ruminococcaceae bacterium OttesenSCG-928-L11]|nr:lytic transglycosylase domain-containing protein [Ruminococcaceae bacterium OttesenSCG-928-L11]
MRRHRTPGRLLVDVLLLAVVMLASIALLQAVTTAYYRSSYPVKYEEYVSRESLENHLPESLVYAVIRTESSFNPMAQSSVGARGLMQITEDTLDWTAYRLGEERPSYEILYDEPSNIKYGTALLRLLLDEFGTIENALCAYHAGWGNANKWLADPNYSPDGVQIKTIPFGDTRQYVEKVLATMQIYEHLYELK